MTKNKEKQKIEDALIDIYLSVKIRQQDDIDQLNTLSLEEEKEQLKTTDPLVIIEYIKTSMDILINLKVEERLESEKHSIENNKTLEDHQNSYEILLRKYESDIRQHIKVIEK